MQDVFSPLPIERIYLGEGVVRKLGEELERVGISRALLLTNRSLASGRLLPEVRSAAGGRVAGEFAGVLQHNPSSGVEAGLGALHQAGADGIIAFGGGSVVDAAKAISHGGERRLPIVDIATTLSGAEFACSFGQTDDRTRVKLGARDPGLTARAVFLDPNMTAETPDWLWAASGFRAVDHAVETILAPNTIPYLDALTSSALEVLSKKLILSLTGAVEPRMLCLEAAWMAHAGSLHIEWGLSHTMGRQLGPRFDIPHGYTSSILLAAVVEMQRDEKVEAEACVAESVGVDSGQAAAALRRLAGELGLPTTLRAAGITRREEVEELFAGNPPALAVIDRAW